MTVDVERQPSAQGPAQPSYIFRGHTAQIHSVHIVRRNTCLVTGDAEGWVVYWKLETKRPLAVWKAHDGAILGTAEWGENRVITHGRDHALRIWQLGSADGSRLSTLLPADGSSEHRSKPWLLHSLPVNTLNFCAFSMCYDECAAGKIRRDTVNGNDHFSPTGGGQSILIAVPARDDKKIEVYGFPQEGLAYVVPRVEQVDTGMTMAVKLINHGSTNTTLVIAGYEGGFTAVHLLPRIQGSAGTPSLALAQTIYLSQPHTQPILGLEASPDRMTFYTSSADAVISAHQVPDLPLGNGDGESSLEDLPESDTTGKEHDGTVQDPSAFLAADGRSSSELVDANHQRQGAANTAATDSNTSNTLLSTSQENGSSDPSLIASTAPPSLSFAKQSIPTSSPLRASASEPGGLSSLLSSAEPISRVKPPPPVLLPVTVQAPFKSINTKHAGQQSLRVRSDGRLLVTGGWDSRVRLYSAKTLREMAVLKWHKDGVYAVDFGEILDVDGLKQQADEASKTSEDNSVPGQDSIIKRETGLGKLQRQREEQMQLKHWVVAGAKDGKVSLWEVF